MSTRQTTIIDDDGVIVKTDNYHYCIFDSDKGYLFKNRAYYVKGYQGIPLSKVVENKGHYANIHILQVNTYPRRFT